MKKLEMKLRKMMGVSLRDGKQTKRIREQTGVADIPTAIKRKKWIWAGHVMWRTYNRWTIRTMECIPKEGKHSRGRQEIR